MGRSVTKLMPPEMAAKHAGFMERYLRTGEKRVMDSQREVPAVTKDGRKLIVELKLSEIKDHTGSREFVAVLNDVTAFRQQADLDHAVFASLRSPVVTADEHGIIVEINEDVTKLFGYSKVRIDSKAAEK